MDSRQLVFHWRRQGLRNFGYVDDFCMGGDSKEATTQIVQTIVKPDMDASGFIIAEQKSHWTPSQVRDMLGLIIDTAQQVFRVPEAD